MSPLKKLKGLSYSKMIALGYFIVITVGTILLSLPFASRGQPADFITALFTATSAACVTGLVVVDTYLQWTLFGQIVILVLLQIGGLGFMTMITLVSILLGRKIGLKERGLLRESVNTQYIGGIVRLAKKILIGTLIFEGIGAIILSIRFIPDMGVKSGIYNAIFHSVSAFCNAGFDLMGRFGAFSSLTTYVYDPIVNLTIIILIIVGGIGFFVWDDLIKHRLHFKKYQLHTKIVITTTAFLILFGTIAFYLLEKDYLLADATFGQALLASLFGSITPRTAGFNTLNVASYTPATKMITMVLMFIGGSPGSTAGGIKTTTLVVLLISLRSMIFHTSGCNVFGRRLSDESLKRSTSVVSVNLILIVSAAILIAATNPLLSLSHVMFEVFSAMGTVGLSAGITASLNVFSKILLMVLMYSGRVGSLTFAFIFTERKLSSTIQNPVERINIG